MAIKISTMNKPKSCAQCRLRENKYSYDHKSYKTNWYEFCHADRHKAKYIDDVVKKIALKKLYEKCPIEEM